MLLGRKACTTIDIPSISLTWESLEVVAGKAPSSLLDGGLEPKIRGVVRSPAVASIFFHRGVRQGIPDWRSLLGHCCSPVATKPAMRSLEFGICRFGARQSLRPEI